MIRVKRGQIMENDLILEIDNVGPISNAKIDIGKINIIGNGVVVSDWRRDYEHPRNVIPSEHIYDT